MNRKRRQYDAETVPQKKQKTNSKGEVLIQNALFRVTVEKAQFPMYR